MKRRLHSILRMMIMSVLMMICVSSVIAQQAKRTIILINGEAYIADLTANGSILQRYQAVPDYFTNGLSNGRIIAQAEASGLTSEGSLELYAESLDDIVPDLTTFRRSEDFTSDGSSQYIAFSRGRALLNQKAVDHIRSIADAYQSGELSQVTIRSYHRDTPTSRTLATNRAKAIIDLLSTFGMTREMITIHTLYGAENDQLYYVYLSFGE